MRVLYIQQHFYLPEEAGYSRGWEFSRRLAREGHDVTVVRGGDSSSQLECAGVRIKTVAARYGNEMPLGRRVVSFAQFMVLALRHCLAARPHVVFASSTPLTVAFPALLTSIVKRRPLVFEVRDLWPEVPVRLGLVKSRLAILAASILESMTYHRSSRVVALSPEMGAGVERLAPEKRVEVIPNGCDFELFDSSRRDSNEVRKQLGWAEDAIIVAYAGGFGFLYELDWVVRLAAELKDTKIQFVLFGAGSSTTGLKALSADLGLNAETLLPGAKPKEEIARNLQAADIIISPLRDAPSLEGSSLNKVFDAMAASKPLIFNHGGWLSEAVVEARGGWRLDRAVDLAARQLREIAEQPSGLIQAGRRNRELGEQVFSREEQFGSFERVLKGATAAEPPSIRGTFSAVVRGWRQGLALRPDGDTS